MRIMKIIALLLSVLFLSSCFSLTVGTEKKPTRVQMKGLASAYASIDGLRPYNGTIMKAGLFSESAREGEWASIDIWPLCGIGVGFIGARVRVLFLEVGAGVLAFDARPLSSKECEEKSDKTPTPENSDEKKLEKTP